MTLSFIVQCPSTYKIYYNQITLTTESWLRKKNEIEFRLCLFAFVLARYFFWSCSEKFVESNQVNRVINYIVSIYCRNRKMERLEEFPSDGNLL